MEVPDREVDLHPFCNVKVKLTKSIKVTWMSHKVNIFVTQHFL